MAVHPVGLRQALLSLITVAIHQAAGGELHIQCFRSGSTVTIQMERTGDNRRLEITPGDEESLKIVRYLMDLCKGQFSIHPGEVPFKANLDLPVFHPVMVLAIDDNADFLQLMERFVSQTRYHMVYTRNPAEMLSLVEKHVPQVIILDVMMPEMDGWQMIGKLRQHPLTGQIPIVICTILAQEELAYALGASAFLHKPVTQDTLLSTLDLITAKELPGSR